MRVSVALWCADAVADNLVVVRQEIIAEHIKRRADVNPDLRELE